MHSLAALGGLLLFARPALAQVEPPPVYVGRDAPAAAEVPAVPAVPDEVQDRAEVLVDPGLSWSLDSLEVERAIASPGMSTLAAELVLKGLALEPERWPESFRASMRAHLADRLERRSRTVRERAKTDKVWADRLESLRREFWTPSEPVAPPKLKIEGKKRGAVHWDTLHKLFDEAGGGPGPL